MKSEDVMHRLRKEILVVSIVVNILSTPFVRGVSTSGTPVGTPFGLVVEPVFQTTPTHVQTTLTCGI